MLASEARDILVRANENLRTNSKDTGSTVAALSPELYLDPLRYQREIQHVFRASPHLVGHVSQVEKPGDFFTLEMLGHPLIVTRDERGQLNALVNACMHRATIVERNACGNRRDFTCPYHGWS